MGTRSDFYIMDHDGSLEWIGSGAYDGFPFSIPTELLLHVNRTTFEEDVVEHLKETNGIINEKRKRNWPWPWADSRMTDYSYILHVCTGKVLMCRFGGRLMDPIKIIQGMDEIGADVGIGTIKFPIMREDAEKRTEEILKIYGPKFAEVI
jgi:hypothetical protein